MNPGDWLLAVISWVHLSAAVLWVGGGLFYLVVLGPSLRHLRPAQQPAFTRSVAENFRGLVELCIPVLLVTGTILTFQRLTAPQATAAYAAVLGLKIALSVLMFALAYWLGRKGQVERLLGKGTAQEGQRRRPWSWSAASATVFTGAAVFLLAELLRALFR